MEKSKSQVLVVGAGAIGQVFGAYLARAGYSVSYLIKENSKHKINSPQPIHRLHSFKKQQSINLNIENLYTDIAKTNQVQWDMVWFCIPTNATTDSWLQQAQEYFGKTVIVSTGQDINERNKLQNYWPSECILQITPALFAFTTTLLDAPKIPTSPNMPSPTITFWTAPGSKQVISGSLKYAQPLAMALSASGLHSSSNNKDQYRGDLVAAITQSYVAGLQLTAWSWKNFCQQNINQAAAAAREAANITAAVRQTKPPTKLITSVIFTKVSWQIIAALAPFDFEEYVQNQFSKITPQTETMLQNIILEGQKRNLKTSQIQQLHKDFCLTRLTQNPCTP